MSKGSRIAGVFVGTAVVAALIAFYIVSYVANKPSAVAADPVARTARCR